MNLLYDSGTGPVNSLTFIERSAKYFNESVEKTSYKLLVSKQHSDFSPSHEGSGPLKRLLLTTNSVKRERFSDQQSNISIKYPDSPKKNVTY